MKTMAILCLIATFLVACVPSAVAQQVLKVGSLGHTMGFLQLDIAEARNWLKTSNLNAQIVYFKAGKDCATALIKGELQAAILGVEHVVTGQKEGVAIKQLMLLNQLPGWTLIVSRRFADDIHSPADLRGRNIGVSAPGSATHTLVSFLLSKYGVKSEEYTIVKAGVATLPDIMKNDGIDAGMALEPYGSEYAATGQASVLVDFRSTKDTNKHLGSTYPLTALLVRQDVLEQHPEAVQDMTNALVWACKVIFKASAKDLLKLLPAEYCADPVSWTKSFDSSRDVFPPDGKNDIDGIKTILAAEVVSGKIDSVDNIDVSSLVDDRFWQKANDVPVPAELTLTVDVGVPNELGPFGTGMIIFLAAICVVVVAGFGVIVYRRKK